MADPGTEVTLKNWNADVVQRRIEARLKKGMKVAVQFLVGETKKSLNRSQPTTRAARGRKGLDPSKPGEPPKKVSAQLQQSVTGKVELFPGQRVEGYIGSNVNHARALEFGFIGDIRVRAHQRQIKAHTRKGKGARKQGAGGRFVKGGGRIKVKAHTQNVPAHTRRMRLAARPFLRPTVFNNKRRTRELIIRGR